MTGRRLLSLDIFRGIAIAGMILVNDPGSWNYVYPPLAHASWHGLTPTDLVFPFFMFIMGISLYFSLSKTQFQITPQILIKIIKRSVIIFLLGLSISWLVLLLTTFHRLAGEGVPFWQRLLPAIWNWENIRILGVLQRLAICYAAAAIIVLLIKHRFLPLIIAVTLMSYSVVLWLGHGFLATPDNIISHIDQAILGANHMYHDTGRIFDPEGLLSTIPAVCHVLIGFCCGGIMLQCATHEERALKLFVMGTALAIIGYLFSYGSPINKKIWSPTFVLVTCGIAANVLALLLWIVDIRKCTRGWRGFEVFGVNPLLSYMIAAWISILFDFVQITINGKTWTVHDAIFDRALQPILGNYPASLAYALLFTGLIWWICRALYRRHIYFKV